MNVPENVKLGLYVRNHCQQLRASGVSSGGFQVEDAIGRAVGDQDVNPVWNYGI